MIQLSRAFWLNPALSFSAEISASEVCVCVCFEMAPDLDGSPRR